MTTSGEHSFSQVSASAQSGTALGLSSSAAVATAEAISSGISSEDRRSETSTSSLSTYHGWVCSGPFFETVLFVYCADRAIVRRMSPGANAPIAFDVFDPDGYHCNRVEISAGYGTVTAIEWDPFLGSCKFEAGLKHAHIVARLPEGFRATSRLVSQQSGCLFGKATRLSTTTRAFMPVMLSRDRFPMLVLLNRSEVEATVRGRLFCGKRTPENVWSIPANGTRVLSIAHEFGDAIALEPEEQVQAYLRMGVRGEYEVGAQFIERLQGPSDGSVFLALG